MNRIKLWRLIAVAAICAMSSQTYAQQMAMSLDECLEYAKTNSITLQKAKLQIDNSVQDQISAKGAFLPSVSGSISQSLSSYPLADDSDLNYGGSYGVDASMTLYSGGENRASLKQSTIEAEISNLAYSEYANALEVAITEVYVEILYAMEQIGVAESTLELNLKNQQRGEALLEAGSISSVDFAQLESATATSRYSLVVAQTDLNSLYVNLRYLLEISHESDFVITQPDLSDAVLMSLIPPAVDVYNSALDTRPEILSSKLAISSAQLDETIAKSGYLPTVSLSAGTGVSHSSDSSYDFSSQLRDNFSTSVGLGVSIPIFSKYINRTSVAKASNNRQIAELSFSEAKKDLYQIIETLHNNASNAQAKFAVSQANLAATKKSMELTTEQYEVGMKNTIELLTEQDNYTQAEQDFLMNKYQLILNKALLNYYKTNVINL